MRKRARKLTNYEPLSKKANIPYEFFIGNSDTEESDDSEEDLDQAPKAFKRVILYRVC